MSAAHVFACDAVRRSAALVREACGGHRESLTVRERLDRQAARILEALEQRDIAAVMHINNWHPSYICVDADQIFAAGLSSDDVRLAIAREYGFEDWAHVERSGDQPPDACFEAAIDALINGDLDSLTRLIDERPELVRQHSAYGHRATLLHYVASNGVETHRQQVPSNLAAVARLLIDRGADVNATARMYGADCTTLALFTTSSHPVDAGVADAVAAVLRAAGAV